MGKALIDSGHRAAQRAARMASVVIPARNEEARIGAVVRAVLEQATPGVEVEVLVVDDGSTDATGERARDAGARTLRVEDGCGSPSIARNRGAAASVGDPIVFLDADCLPAPGWLDAIVAAHDAGDVAVGGSLDLPEGLSFTARCDYYCGWYLVHSLRAAGPVPHHPPPNLSVRREAFFDTSGFTDGYRIPAPRRERDGERDVEDHRRRVAHNEERVWQSEIRAAGHRIWFEPRARAYHYNRPGLRGLLRRSYRWAYTSIQSKCETGVARFAGLYRHPLLLICLAGPLALAQTAWIVAAWLRAGRFEPLLMLPLVLASRVAYAAGMTVGGLRWLRSKRGGSP